jgi:hypothetical protein
MKQKLLTIALGASCGLMLTGCATLFGGGAKQNITIQSNEPKNLSLHYIDKNDVISPTIQTFQTPKTISVGRENKDIIFKDTDEKCEDLRVKKEMNDWVWGDILALSLLSTTVDAVTGAMWEYDENVNIECQK